jgi:hypothetical protein
MTAQFTDVAGNTPAPSASHFLFGPIQSQNALRLTAVLASSAPVPGRLMESAFEAVFGAIQHVTWWQECLRAVLAFVYGLVILRCTGRRTFAAWSAIDIVVSIMFGSSMSRMITRNASMPGTFAAMSLLVFLHWLIARAVAQGRKLSLILEGPP